MKPHLETDPLAWLALARMEEIGGVRGVALVNHFGSPRKALEAPLEAWQQVLGGAIAAKARSSGVDWAGAKGQLDRLKHLGGRLLTLADEDYPDLLRQTSAPPLVLFWLGQWPVPGPCVAIVGSRRASEYGLNAARYLAGELAQRGFVIVSGMAQGIDGAAHGGALRVGGSTLAVLGCGADRAYPAMHQELHRQILHHGAVLSEYPLGAKPEQGWFPQRNRLISGLSLGTIVVEAPGQSGALITARYALEQNREVFAVPGPIFDKRNNGCHRLIKEGAKLVEGVEDIVEELQHLNLSLEEREHAPEILNEEISTTPEEKQILGCLETQVRDIDGLSAVCNLEPAALLELLLRLELAGLVEALPGRRYALAS